MIVPNLSRQCADSMLGSRLLSSSCLSLISLCQSQREYPPLTNFSKLCVKEYWSGSTTGANAGRISTSICHDSVASSREIARHCCGDSNQYCHGGGGIPTVCSDSCGDWYEKFYSQCRHNLAASPGAKKFKKFLKVCQMKHLSNGRRHLLSSIEAKPVA